MRQVKYFTADWCAPCKTLKPIMAELRSEGLPIEMINVDLDPEAVGRYGIRSVPTCVVSEGGQEVDRWSGIKSKDEIRRLITG